MLLLLSISAFLVVSRRAWRLRHGRLDRLNRRTFRDREQVSFDISECIINTIKSSSDRREEKSKYKFNFYLFLSLPSTSTSLPPSLPHPSNYFQMRRFESPSQGVIEEQPSGEAAAAIPAAIPAAAAIPATMPEEVDTEDSGLGGCVNSSYISSDNPEEFVSTKSNLVEEAEEEESEETDPKVVYGFPSSSPVRPSFVQDGAAATVDEPLPRPPSPIAAVRWKKRGKMAVSVQSVSCLFICSAFYFLLVFNIHIDYLCIVISNKT